MFVTDNKDHVKARQDGRHEVDVLGPLCVIPPAIHTISGSQH